MEKYRDENRNIGKLPLSVQRPRPICRCASHRHDWCQSLKTNYELWEWTSSPPAETATDRFLCWPLPNRSFYSFLRFPKFFDLRATYRWRVHVAIDREGEDWIYWFPLKICWDASLTSWTFLDTFGLKDIVSTGVCGEFGVLMLALSTDSCSGSSIDDFCVDPGASCNVADLRKITSKAERKRLSAAVIVEYGVDDGLVDVSVEKWRKLNEFVFFNIDLRGNEPKFGLLMVSLAFFACGGSISLLANSRNFETFAAGTTSKRDGRRPLLLSSASFFSFSNSSRARSCASFCHLAATSSRFSRPICLSIILMSSWRWTDPKRIIFSGVSTTGKLRKCLFF